MKRLFCVIPLVCLLCFAFGCQDKAAMEELEAFKTQAAVEEQNKALVIRYTEAWENGNLESIKEFYSPDFVWHAPYGQDMSAEQHIERNRKNIEQLKVGFPDMTITSEDVIAKGDKVITRYTFRLTHTGDYKGLPATGEKIRVRGIEIVRVENGKIAESWEEADRLGFSQQLGMELKPKEGEK